MMQITTWNVNGLRSTVSHGFQDWLDRKKPDVVCLQETKMMPDMLTESWFENYRLIIYPAKKAGYAGTGILYRKNLNVINIEYGMGIEEFDCEGRVLSVEFEEFEIICIYAPHSHRELINLNKKIHFGRSFNTFLSLRMNREGRKPIVLAGDLNVAFEERDVFHFKNNRGNAGFHDSEKEWFSKVLEIGFVDALRTITDESGIYSWWSLLPGVREKNAGWRLDYLLVEKQIENSIEDCFHSMDERGSDHCPVTLVLRELE